MKNTTRTLVSLCLSLAVAACEIGESDDAGCSSRDVEAVVVSIEPAPQGDCSSPVYVLVDIVDPETGEILHFDYPLADQPGVPVSEAWLADEGIEIGTLLFAQELGWCVGGGYWVDLSMTAAESCTQSAGQLRP